MNKYRLSLLSALLLAVVGLYLYQAPFPPVSGSPQQPAPLDGENELGDIWIKPFGGNNYQIHADYRYRGNFTAVRLRVHALETKDTAPGNTSPVGPLIQPGERTAYLQLWRDHSKPYAYSTQILRLEMVDLERQQVIVSKDIEYPIDWVRMEYTWSPETAASESIQALYRAAVAEIDFGSGSSLRNARAMLETILTREPDFLPAFPELARYHMASSRGAEGRRQAEQVLGRALQIDPEHADSQVLIGYVYTHQGRPEAAEAAFRKAAQIGSDNLWLWVNWGELLLMKGQVSESIAMFNKAIAADRPYNTYDHAQRDAYRRLIEIARLSDDPQAANRLHLGRISKYPGQACFSYQYAEFRQLYFDDASIVIEHAQKALDGGCRPAEDVRKLLGTGYYAKWHSTTDIDDAKALLLKARLNFPEGPQLIHWLARSEKTLPVIERLLENGISIDIKDNRGMTALAYALKDDDLDVVKRIITLGGNPNVTIGAANTPILAVAVMSQRENNVRYLLEQGASADGEIYEGLSLIDYAESMGYTKIAEILRLADSSQRI